MYQRSIGTQICHSGLATTPFAEIATQISLIWPTVAMPTMEGATVTRDAAARCFMHTSGTNISDTGDWAWMKLTSTASTGWTRWSRLEKPAEQ